MFGHPKTHWHELAGDLLGLLAIVVCLVCWPLLFAAVFNG